MDFHTTFLVLDFAIVLLSISFNWFCLLLAEPFNSFLIIMCFVYMVPKVLEF